MNALMEGADPGYIDRQVSKARSENNHYFVSPYYSLGL
jgi:hypothetical protein